MTGSKKRGASAAGIVLALGLVLGLMLSACGGGGDSGASSVAPAPASQNRDQALSGSAESQAAGGSAASAPDAAKSSGALSSSPLVADSPDRKLVRTADLQLKVKNVEDAAAQVRAAAQRLGGAVASEDGRTAISGSPARDVLVVRVPEPKLDEMVTAAAQTGSEVSRTASSQDVTAQLADLESREKSQQASVDRVRELMSRATTLQDIVTLESELSRRETDLEAAQASRRSMADQAADATLTITLTGTQPGAVTEKQDDDSGFVAGLKRSWHTVQDSTTVLLTILGALLPFAIVVAVISWPAWILVRRNRTQSPARTRPTSSSTHPAYATTAPAPSTPPAGSAAPAPDEPATTASKP